jgi:hypothetical protein
MFIVDIVKLSLVGDTPFHIQRLVSRRLNTKMPGGATKYITILESSIIRHRLIKLLGRAHEGCRSKREFRCRANKIDRDIPFSPEAALWIRRALVYRLLLWYHLGLIRNKGNLKRRACWGGILNCLSILIPKVRMRLWAATEHFNFYQKHGKYYRTKHLYQCLASAREAQQETREREIFAIIQREKAEVFGIVSIM